MMRKIITLLLMASFSFGAEIEVTADKFRASESEQQGVFTGNVTVTKGEDLLKSDKLIIFFDENKDPLKYEATGNASVKMKLNDMHYFGEGEVLVYEPKNMRYTIKKSGFLHEIETDRKVYGDLIVADQNSGTYEVDSKESEPVKFIFHVEEEKEPSEGLLEK